MHTPGPGVGELVGDTVGEDVGLEVGELVGLVVGLNVGEVDGDILVVGDSLGYLVTGNGGTTTMVEEREIERGLDGTSGHLWSRS